MPTVLITGASRGIGLEFTRQYLRDGWQVIATCRTPATATSLQKLGGQYPALQIAPLDVADLNGIGTLAHQLDAITLDLLINNAGIFSGDTKRNPNLPDISQSFGTLDAAAWNQVLYVNSIAPVMVTQAFLPHLLRGQDRKVVMLTSKMGSIGLLDAAGDIAYRSSKAALNAALRNLALTLEPENFTVVGVHPGWVQTDMGGKMARITVTESVDALRTLIGKLIPVQSGSFLDYDGSVIAW